MIETEYVLQVELFNEDACSSKAARTWYALFRDYTLEIIATRKFPRGLTRCAQYAVTEAILRQTAGSFCHENVI